ncbi:MAG: GAF domain-containing protein, partial [Gaiellaceae bacterium]
MNGESPLEHAGNRHALLRRTRLARYGFAAVAALMTFLTMVAFVRLHEDPPYAVAVGAVAVAVWYGGFGPGLLSVAIGWPLAFVAFVGESGSLDAGTDEEQLRWVTALVVGLAVVWVSAVMRRGQERAVLAVVEAEESMRELAGLQELAASLSAAASPREVARALVSQTPILLGARGGALGLIEDDELVIVDPQGADSQTHQPGFRLPLLARAPISHAARTGAAVKVDDRATFEREFPDGAALSLSAQREIAVPLFADGEVVGSMSFLFDKSGIVTEDTEAIARIAADLGGQALERARLYARERESRRALDRILRVSPRFHTDSAESAAEAICDEARETFGADFAFLWRVDGTRLELVGSDSDSELIPPGLEGTLEDFPNLHRAIDRLEISFASDVQEEARGVGLERTRTLGLRSSLRVPISIGGDEARLVLIVAWNRVIGGPDPSTLALMRRLADQAAFALEQVERRRAEAEAALRADETRRLQEVTAALSLASTATDVSDTCLEHALSAVGAEAGFVVLFTGERVTVDFVSSSGYSDDELEHWGQFALDANVPFARAIASGEAVWALTLAEMAGFNGGGDLTDQGWVALPLRTPAGVRGALHMTFRQPRELTEETRRWLQAVVSQCALALERSRLFDAEQVLRRRSERLQGMIAALSNALTRTDVAELIVGEIGDAVAADGVALAVVSEERRLVRALAWRGYGEDRGASLLEVPLDAATPGNRALERRVSGFYATNDELREEFAEPFAGFALVDHASFLFVPLVARRRATGLLVLSWTEPYTLEAEERRFVETLAGHAAQALERASQFESERSIAETLQRSFLPASLPRVEGIQLAARYLPGTADL